jgi:hypothetical protein
MRNVRRYFRLDLELPAVIKLADQNQIVRIIIPELSGDHWEKEEQGYNTSIQQHLQHLIQENEVAGKVVADLFSRIKLLAEAIIWLVQGASPEEKITNYSARRRVVALATHLKSGSAIGDLLKALNDKIEFYLSAVDAAGQRNYQAFLGMMKFAEFAFDHYLEGLNKKAMGDPILATVLLELDAKLARYLNFLRKYQQEAEYFINPDKWSLRKLNLSAGGVSFLSQDPYPKFARLIIQFRIGPQQKQFDMTGNIVSSRTVNNKERYIAVEFTNATEAIQNQLILFIQNEELNQLIAYKQQHTKVAVDNEAW